MSKATSRRNAIIGGAKLAVGAAAIGALSGIGARPAAAATMPVGSDTKNRCATCEFWGGQRKVSEDGKSVVVSSLGYCSNPKSPNYQKVTGPQTGPMAVWKKWGAIA